jgi:hypothetical protein
VGNLLLARASSRLVTLTRATVLPFSTVSTGSISGVSYQKLYQGNRIANSFNNLQIFRYRTLTLRYRTLTPGLAKCLKELETLATELSHRGGVSPQVYPRRVRVCDEPCGKG